MKSYRTEQVNNMTATELGHRLALLIAVMLTDARLNADVEAIDINELWHAAQHDGFTPKTFAAAYTTLSQADEILHQDKSGSFWVPATAEIYDDMLRMVNEYHAWERKKIKTDLADLRQMANLYWDH